MRVRQPALNKCSVYKEQVYKLAMERKKHLGVWPAAPVCLSAAPAGRSAPSLLVPSILFSLFAISRRAGTGHLKHLAPLQPCSSSCPSSLP